MASPSTEPVTDALATLGDEALSLCQALLRIDTTNPPGNERPAAQLLDRSLREVGYEPTLLESADQRANLVCRYKGKGTKPPLLLTAHLDVVEASADRWRYPPFSGEIAEGCLWGRGAVDMKNMAAMSTAVMRQLARGRVELARDVIFAAVADEEAGCDYGSRWLVDNHAELVEAEFALGEVGGFSLHLGKSTYYPVQVAEKGTCWIRARVTGEPGHGSLPRTESAVVKLGEALARLGKAKLPTHATATTREFFRQVAAHQPGLLRPLARGLVRPSLLDALIKRAPDNTTTRGIKAMISNTASPTVVAAGHKVNVIPEIAEFQIDGRTLPGQTDDDLLRELREVLGPGVELEIIRSAPPVVTEPYESELFDVIRAEVETREPGAKVVPYLTPGYTDAKYFSQLGMRWYGFSPVKIDRDSGIRFADLFHGQNERVPVDGLRWGAEVLYAVVSKFCT
jgi:acetylornithine deacetylase/succinyl-diaminopimelate desuccinylase-like protein